MKFGLQNLFFKVESIWGCEDSVLLELDEESVDFSLKDVQEVPLTEEWLLKLGFKKQGVEFLHPDTKITVYSNKDISLYFDEADKKFFVDTFKLFNLPDIEIEYIHELQNLYFALTKKELKIK